MEVDDRIHECRRLLLVTTTNQNNRLRFDTTIEEADKLPVAQCVGDDVICEDDGNTPGPLDVLKEKHN